MLRSSSRQRSGNLPRLGVVVIVVVAFGCDSPQWRSHAKRPARLASKPRELPVPSHPAVRFVELAKESGIDFSYRNGEETDQAAMLESLGGGVALIDYDADGRLDVFFVGGGEFGPDQQIRGRSPALYRNDGEWSFVDVTEFAGLAIAPYYSHGTAVGDFDEDGFPDLLVTGYAGVLLWHNCGDGTFKEVAESAGLKNRLLSTSAAWGDLTSDGVLDVYIANYVNWSFQHHPFCKGPMPGQREVCLPRDFEPLPDVFYAGNGDGTFRDATKEAGLSSDGKGLGVLLADIDTDGDLDVYVANDTTPNFLYRNQGKGHLSELGIINGAGLSDVGLSDGSMGVDLGDFNLDGLPDLWVTNFEEETMGLYRNQGDFVFHHVSRAVGLQALLPDFIAFGTVFFDADRDGDLDLFVSNGHVNRFPVRRPRKQRPLLLENIAGRRFENIAPRAGPYFATGHIGRGAAVGDLDNDGDPDLVVSHTNDPVAVLRNESSNQHHWIGLRLIGSGSHRDAVGAIVRVTTSNSAQVRQRKGGTSYLSSSDPRLLFGLASEKTIQQIVIRWPSGTVQQFSGTPVDRFITVHEPLAP